MVIVFLCFFRFKKFKMRKLLVVMAVSFGLNFTLFAQQETSLDSIQQLDDVIVDTKIPSKRKNSGKTVTVLDEKILQQHLGHSVAEVLDQVSGITINGSQSNNGQTLGYYIRGGGNRQVLIVIDGVPVNDASQIANDYDLRLLSVGSIEKIEIMKGASSVLYGSGAATAVISITTKKEVQKAFGIQVQSVLGTDRASEEKSYALRALSNHITASGTLGKFYYKASVNHQFSDGLSAIEAPEGEAPFEEDTFNNFNTLLNLGVQLTEKIRFNEFVSFDRLQNDFDDFGYLDANYQNTTKQFRTGGHFEWKYNKGIYVFNDNYSVIKREISSSFPAKYEAKTYTFDNYLQHHLWKPFKMVLGLQGTFSKMDTYTIPFGETEFNQDINEDMANFNYFDPYINVVYTSNFGLNINAGTRMNIHKLYGNHFVYQVNPSYRLDIGRTTVKLLSSYSTAYITPSLYQLFDPLYGNVALQPEESATLEGGFEISSNNEWRVSAVYFNRRVDQFVDFVTVDPDNFIYQYRNIDERFEASGLEVETALSLWEKVNVTANYTYTQPEERFALRIPTHKLNGSIQYNPFQKTRLGLQFQYVSERDDQFFNPETFASDTIALKAYTLFNVTASQQISENVKLFLGIDNLLDEEFSELYRYQTKGRNIRFGFQLNI